MVSFQTKRPNLGIFWRTLEWKLLLYILVILWPLGTSYGYFVAIWYIFPRLVSCTKKNLATLLDYHSTLENTLGRRFTTSISPHPLSRVWYCLKRAHAVFLISGSWQIKSFRKQRNHLKRNLMGTRLNCYSVFRRQECSFESAYLRHLFMIGPLGREKNAYMRKNAYTHEISCFEIKINYSLGSARKKAHGAH
jgi:hypothetical protein